MTRTKIYELGFLATITLVTVAFIMLILPYYGAVLWAVILAILFNPLQNRLVQLTGGRRNVAAILSVLACICIVVIPGTLIMASLAQEATGLYERIGNRQFAPGPALNQLQNSLPDFVRHGLDALDLGNISEIEAKLTSFFLQASQIIATKAVTIGQNTAQFIISLGVMLYLLFFLFRDGRRLIDNLRRASPLEEHHTDHILEKFSSVVKATVKGNVIIAIIQGAIGGVTFWLLGIQAALLWAVLMAILSLLPAVGSALIWVPTALYLALTGDYLKAGILLAVGVLIISMIDNFLRPPLVGRGTMLPDYAVLISTLGGLSMVGMNGFVIGPLIVALFVAVWSLFADDKARMYPPGEQT
ncbi:MAG: AI-2E family transporter [Xanthobacter sp.]